MPRPSPLLVLCVALLTAGAATPLKGASGGAALTPTSLRIEYRMNPLGIDVLRPRLSWKLQPSEGGAVQTAYQIQAAARRDALDEARDLLWDTGQVASDQSVHIVYGGPPLKSRGRYYWRVRVWDGQGRPSAWSEPAFWEMGLLSPEDWQAAWIGGRQHLDHDWADARVTIDFTFQPSAAMPLPPQAGGNPFAPPSEPEENDITPLNFLFRARPVGKTYGETYNWQITQVEGRPTLRTKVCRYPGGRSSNTTVTTLKEIPLPNITATDLLGKRHQIVIDARGPRIQTWIDGLLVDTTIDSTHASGTIGVQAPASDVAVLHRVFVEAAGQTVFETAFEGGANPFTAGRAVKDGLLVSGRGRERWEPSFNYKGFRYVQVEGYPGTPTAEALLGKIVHSAVDTVGTFTSSNELLGKIQQAARNTILNNLHGFQTDTPTYEKNGWTGDAHASSLAAALNFDVASVWTKWMADFRDAQSDKGEIPEIVPSTPFYGYEDTPGWSVVSGPVPSWDAATLVIPWDQYVLYGDTRILEEMYETQRRLVDYTGTYFTPESFVYDNPNNTFLGEYAAAVSFEGGRLRFAAGPIDATAAAYYYHMIDLLARSADILGKTADATAYRALAERVREAYNARYWDADREICRTLGADGQPAPYAQTQNVLPLAFGMVPAGHEAAVARHLNEDIAANAYHLTSAGVFAIRYLMTLLSDYGYTDTAFRVATQTDETG